MTCGGGAGRSPEPQGQINHKRRCADDAFVPTPRESHVKLIFTLVANDTTTTFLLRAHPRKVGPHGDGTTGACARLAQLETQQPSHHAAYLPLLPHLYV